MPRFRLEVTTLLGAVAVWWAMLTLGCGRVSFADEITDIQATADYTAGKEAFDSLSDADTFTYINLLTVDSYWSMDALGSNSPPIDLITRRHRRKPGRYYTDSLFTGTSTLRIDRDGTPRLTDLSFQAQPTSFDAESGYVTSAFRVMFRTTTAEQAISAAGTNYTLTYDRYMLATTIVSDMWGFKFWIGPKFLVRVDRFAPESTGQRRGIAETITPGFHFQLAASRNDNPPAFEWTLSRFDISFSKKFFQDVSIDFRWMDTPELDEEHRRPPRLYEFETTIRWGSTSDRRLIGGKGRIWALTGAFYYNYYDGRLAWTSGGLEFRADFLVLAGRVSLVLPNFIGAKPRVSFGGELALSTVHAFGSFRPTVFVKYESAPYSYDAALRGETEPSPANLQLGMAFVW